MKNALSPAGDGVPLAGTPAAGPAASGLAASGPPPRALVVESAGAAGRDLLHQ